MLKKDMLDSIHFQKDSVGPERFVVTIDVDSMQQIRELQSQLLQEHKEYQKLVQIKKYSIYPVHKIPYLIYKEIIKISKNHLVCGIKITSQDMDNHKIASKTYNLCD